MFWGGKVKQIPRSKIHLKISAAASWHDFILCFMALEMGMSSKPKPVKLKYKHITHASQNLQRLPTDIKRNMKRLIGFCSCLLSRCCSGPQHLGLALSIPAQRTLCVGHSAWMIPSTFSCSPRPRLHLPVTSVQKPLLWETSL